MKIKIIGFVFPFLFLAIHGFSQSLKTDFDAKEYKDLLLLAGLQYFNKDTVISHYNLEYRSPEMGLKSKWDLWLRDDQVVP
jgi:hypothetical protein